MNLRWISVATDWLAAVVLLAIAFRTSDAGVAALEGALGGWFLCSMFDHIDKAVRGD